jgi:hypothetical protein
MIMMRDTEKVTTTILAKSPVPKSTKESGINAGDGMVLKKSIIGSK